MKASWLKALGVVPLLWLSPSLLLAADVSAKRGEAVADAMAKDHGFGAVPIKSTPRSEGSGERMRSKSVATETVSTEVSSAKPETSDLLSLFRESQQQNPQLLALDASVRRAGYQRREAMGRLLPQLSVETRQTTTDYSSGSLQTEYSGERYVGAMSQVLFDMPAWQSYKRFQALALQAKLQGEEDTNKATVDLVQRYLNVLAAQDSLELIEAEKRVVLSNLERIRSLYERQLVPITDKLEVEARFDRLLADEIESRNNVAVHRAGLSELVGRDVYEPIKSFRQDLKLEGLFDLKDPEHWSVIAAEGSPLLASRQAAVEAQAAARKEALGGHLPQVTLQVVDQKSNIGYENARSDRSQSTVAEVNVRVPLFSGGSTSARSGAATESLYIARQELEQARRQVQKETKVAYMNCLALLSKAKAADLALKSSQKAHDAAERSFTYGLNNAVDVLDRAREQYSAERDLLEARYRFLLSYLILRQWSGTLTDQDLERVNHLLDGDERIL